MPLSERVRDAGGASHLQLAARPDRGLRPSEAALRRGVPPGLGRALLLGLAAAFACRWARLDHKVGLAVNFGLVPAYVSQSEKYELGWDSSCVCIQSPRGPQNAERRCCRKSIGVPVSACPLDVFGPGIVTCEQLHHLSKVTQLLHLLLESHCGNSLSELRDEHLESLSVLCRLKHLSFRWYYLGVGMAGAAFLSALKSVTLLDSSDCTQFGDAAASHLSGLNRLRHLDLHATDVGDAGAHSLSALTNLSHFDLGEVHGTVCDAYVSWSTHGPGEAYWVVGDSGVEQLSKLVQLRRLVSNGTFLSDRGLRHLAVLGHVSS